MKHLIHKASVAGTTIVGTLLASPAFAQVQNQYLADVGAGSGLVNREFTEVLGSIISAILAFLGLVLLIFIIQSGIQWMTAGGDTDKVQEAKDRIVNAVIGLVLVLAALSISNFVFTTLNSAVSGT